MSITRKALVAMGIENEKAEQLLDMHLETVNGLKEVITSLKTENERIPTLSDELKQLKALKEQSDDYKAKYESEKSEFENFKKKLEIEKTDEAKKKAYRDLLEKNNIRKDKMDLIMRTVRLSDLNLQEDNTLENSEELNKSILKDWSDFVEHTAVKGTNAANPPISTVRSFTREDIRGMSAEEINKNWEAIKVSLKNGE